MFVLTFKTLLMDIQRHFTLSEATLFEGGFRMNVCYVPFNVFANTLYCTILPLLWNQFYSFDKIKNSEIDLKMVNVVEIEGYLLSLRLCLVREEDRTNKNRKEK